MWETFGVSFMDNKVICCEKYILKMIKPFLLAFYTIFNWYVKSILVQVMDGIKQRTEMVA